MRRIDLPERPGWRDEAKELGFGFHTMYGEPYWDETKAYVFSLEEIEKGIEDVSQEVYSLCLELVDKVTTSEELLTKLAIPSLYWDWIAKSWKNREPSLYGRFDFVFNENSPAKMLEFNADTPTALYETGFFQWMWLEGQIERGVLSGNVDQYNSVQEKLINRFSQMFEPGYHFHFSSVKDHDEDRATVRYLEDCARQAGLATHFVAIEDIGVDGQGRFADTEGFVIDALFKLYPYEDMFREEYGLFLPDSSIRLIEPPWKSILSNKGILPLLWQMFPGHPNLLPAYFEGDLPHAFLPEKHVIKPLFSREGANILIRGIGEKEIETDGHYGREGRIVQSYVDLPKFGDDFMVIGSWIVGDEAAGICIREDRARVTQDMSRFVPHFIEE